MEWNGIEWGGTDNLPHFFLLILGASESFFFFVVVVFFFFAGAGGGVEFNSGVEVRSYALPVFQMKLQTVCPLYFGWTLNPRSLTDSSDLSDGTFTRKNLLP